MPAAEVLSLSPEGLYCPEGQFHIDPMRPVERALITHAHSDHARAGHGKVLASEETLALMRVRLGARFAGSPQAITFGETVRLGDVDVSFRPAGHVLGSAQIVITHGARRTVVSGDYKRAADPTCVSFEPVACDLFVSEATFALPVFRHPPAADEIRRLLASCALFPDRPHLVGVYSLGKAQRLAALLRQAGYDKPIHVHGAITAILDVYRAFGQDFGDIRPVEAGRRHSLVGQIVLCPPAALADLWARRFADPVRALASGWMRIRARARQSRIELPLVISDHADWDELCATISGVGCGEVWVTHGQEDALVHWAQGRGLRARPLRLIGYGDEPASDVTTQDPE
jgi:putative mRNA 3-end processing factor